MNKIIMTSPDGAQVYIEPDYLGPFGEVLRTVIPQPTGSGVASTAQRAGPSADFDPCNDDNGVVPGG